MKEVSQQIRLGVSRHLRNRPGDPQWDSPLALELHNRRKEFLHEFFDGNSSWQVEDWGATDDSKSHEYVELITYIIQLASDPHVQAVAVPALVFVAEIISNAAGSLVAKGVEAIFAPFRKAQTEQKIQEVDIITKDQTRITLSPIDDDADIIITLPNQKQVTIRYNDSVQQINDKANRSGVA